jgi:hypothetical protein
MVKQGLKDIVYGMFDHEPWFSNMYYTTGPNRGLCIPLKVRLEAIDKLINYLKEVN